MRKRGSLYLYIFLQCLCVAAGLKGGSLDQRFEQEEVVPIADLAAIPSSIVARSVNVVTGDYCEAETDLLLPGAESLSLSRFYTSSDFFDGFLCDGWNLSHCSLIQMEGGEKGAKAFALLTEGTGAQLLFEGKSYGKKRPAHLTMSEKVIKKGLTNTGSGFLNGQTNLKNTRVCYHPRGECTITFGDGAVRHYQERNSLNGVFDLVEEALSNGNRIQYQYGKLGRIERIAAVNCEGSTLNELSLQYGKGCVVATGFGGQTITYSLRLSQLKLEGVRASVEYLEKVIDDRGVKTRYAYELAEKGHQERVRRKELPEGRFLEISYYGPKDNWVGKQKVKISSRDDPRLNRVSMVREPAGEGGVPVTTYRFFYDLKKKKGKVVGGCTTVFDVHGNKKTYRFGKEHRLIAVCHYDENGCCYSTERMYWGDKSSQDVSNLISHVYRGGNGEILFCRHYTYDGFGNVVKERLYGNLTGGEAPGSLCISYRGEPRGGEYYEKCFQYSQDGRNLLLKEWDGEQEIVYSYEEERALCTARLVKISGKIVERQFQLYDENAVAIWSVTDDGEEECAADLTGVTERHITKTVPTEAIPIGLPWIVEESYLDLDTGDEQLLIRKEHTYSPQGWLLKESLYDAEGDFAYQLYWEYDAQGQVIREVNALGEVTHFAYDLSGNLIREEKEGEGFYQTYKYDLMNRCIEVSLITDTGQRFSESFSYDAKGNRTEKIDRYGNATTLKYDPFGRVIELKEPPIEGISPTWKYTYDERGNCTLETDPNGGVTVREFAVRGDPYFIRYPDGSKEHYFYNLEGRLVKAIGRCGLVTEYHYDYKGRVIREINSSKEGELLQERKYSYSAFRKLSETDPEGNSTHFVYDYAGRLIKEISGSRCTSYIYNPLGKVQKMLRYDRDARENSISETYSYDLLGRLSAHYLGGTEEMTCYRYDQRGRQTELARATEQGPVLTRFEFDPFGREICMTDPDNNQTLTEEIEDYVNACGQHVRYQIVTLPLGRQTVTEFDALGRTVRETLLSAEKETVRTSAWRYDLMGNCLSYEVFSGSHRTEWEYDALGQITLMREAAGTRVERVTHYAYTPTGHVAQVIKPDGVVLTYTYDLLDRLLSLKASDGSVHDRFTYDRNGNVIHAVDAINDQETERSYDSQGEVIKECLANGLYVATHYDGMGRPLRQILPDQTGITYVYQGPYLEEVTRIGKKGKRLYSHRYRSYTPLGEPKEAIVLGNGGKIAYSYDQMGRLKEIRAPNWNESGIVYDAEMNVLERNVSDTVGDCSIHYSYDSQNLLTQETGEPKRVYDSFFNCVEKGEKHYCYNALNQRVGSYAYDKNGNLTKDVNKGIVCSYDALNRLKQVTLGEKQIRYSYDAFNRRLIEEEYRWDPQSRKWNCTNQKRLLYLGENEVGSVDAQGNLTALRLLGIGKGAEIGAAVAIELAGGVYIPIHDSLGNVAALLDERGNPLEVYRYTAFGEASVFDGNGEPLSKSYLGNPWRFSSKRVFSLTGWSGFGRRDYCPKMGRWLTPDPKGLEGGVNFYAFVLNNPMKSVDLYGLEPTHPFEISVWQRPYLKDPLKRHARTFLPFFERMRSKQAEMRNRPRSRNFDLGREEISDSKRLIFVNGILNNFRHARSSALHISDSFGKTNVHSTFCGTRGILSDLVQYCCLKWGFDTEEVDLVEENIRTRMDAVGLKGKVTVITHSNGGLTTYRALKRFSSDEKQRLEVITLGSAQIMGPTSAAETMNFVSELDPIPRVTHLFSWGGRLRSADSPIQLLKSNGVPGFDHAMDCNAYQNALKFLGEKYVHESQR